MTKEAPTSFNISAEMSPVCAPNGLSWQDCPPIATGVRAQHAAAAAIKVAGGQISRSLVDAAPSFTIAHIAEISARALLRPCIFQLPATSGRGIVVMSLSYVRGGIGGSPRGSLTSSELEISSRARFALLFRRQHSACAHSSELGSLAQTRKSRKIETW